MNIRNIFVLALGLFSLRCVEVQSDTTLPFADASADAVESGSTADSSGSETSNAGNPDISIGADAADVSSEGIAPTAEAGDGDALPDAADATEEPEPCVPCAKQGAQRCAADLAHLETCVLRAGCLGWRVAAACAADQICCALSCVAADATNCYGCGAMCGGATPVCDKTIKACGCDTASCTAMNEVCDPNKHACTLDPTRPDVYVDAAADLTQDGTKAHPYQTITAALNAPRASGVELHVHVAPGRYYYENFPLVLRGAFIDGHDATDTFIVGSGKYTPAGAVSTDVMAAVVVGDAITKSGINHVTIYDSSPVPAISDASTAPSPPHYAVFCDRGNAAAKDLPPVTPNTTVDSLVVGPGYDIGVVATTTSAMASAGCNLLVKSSQFRVIDTGVWAVGCDNPANAADTTRIAVAAQLGDGTQDGGNDFEGFQLTRGVGARVLGCVDNFRASYNKFFHVDGGIDVRQPAHQETNHFAFTQNQFQNLQQFGLRLRGQSIAVSDLSFNAFQFIMPSRFDQDPGGALAAALWVECLSTDTTVATIASASSNQFFSNQVGVLYESDFALSNFGTANFGRTNLSDGGQDSGGNAFSCNGVAAGNYLDSYGLVGGDVIIRGTKFPDTFFSFDYNEWDHATPTSQTALTTDGTDITVTNGTVISTGQATEASQSCP